MAGTTQQHAGQGLVVTQRPTPEEVLHLAARCETMGKTFQKYGAAYQSFQSAAHSLRSAVGHVMVEPPLGGEDIDNV